MVRRGVNLRRDSARRPLAGAAAPRRWRRPWRGRRAAPASPVPRWAAHTREGIPMHIVNIYDAKTHLSRLLAQVVQGEEIIIARAGKPLAKLVPYREDDQPRVP